MLLLNLNQMSKIKIFHFEFHERDKVGEMVLHQQYFQVQIFLYYHIYLFQNLKQSVVAL